MTNADLTVRVLSGLGALGSIAALVGVARELSRPAERLQGLLPRIFFSLGVLTYGLGRALAGPGGPDTAVAVVGGVLFACGAIGIALANRSERHRAQGIRDLG